MPASHRITPPPSTPPSAAQRFVTALSRELTLTQLLASLSAGLINGIIAVIVSIAFANLIFAGNLPSFLTAGTNLMLLASIILAAVAALTSSLPGVVAGLQDSGIAVLAVVAVTIVQTMPPTATPTEAFFTTVAAISLSTILTGIVFFLLGHFKWGNLIRFVPYPVIGGFLAGTGLLLVLGALSTMVESFNGPADFPQLFSGTAFLAWGPGAVFAILLFVALSRFDHPLTLPGMLIGATVIFHSMAWLLPGPPLPAGLTGGAAGEGDNSLGNILILFNLQYVDWPVLGGQIMSGVSVAIVSVIGLLLNASGLELETRRDLDLNRELRITGIFNVLTGLAGGAVGFHALGDTKLAYQMGARSRLVGLTLAAFCGLVLLTGGSWLEFLPKPVLGGVLLFLGLDFLMTWVYQTWFKLPPVDYSLIILIVAVITLIGFLEGIGLGLALTVILFVVDYSQVNIVRHSLTGATYQSNFQYPRLYQRLLQRNGHQIHIFELQGFIFFGSAHKLLEQVKQRLKQNQPAHPRFVVLDFRLVSGFDTSAVFSFTRMKQLALMDNLVLVFTHLSPKMERHLEKDIFQPDEQHLWRVFPDLDRGVEWCEAQFMHTLESVGFNTKTSRRKRSSRFALPAGDKFDKLLTFLHSEDDGASAGEYSSDRHSFELDWLKPYLHPIEAAPGDRLIRQNEVAPGLYFIESGQVTIQLEQGDGGPIRLSTMGAGTVVGELGFYLGTRASASVIVDQPGQIYRLSTAKLDEIENNDPHLKAALHEFMARLLSERLLNANDTLQALLK